MTPSSLALALGCGLSSSSMPQTVASASLVAVTCCDKVLSKSVCASEPAQLSLHGRRQAEGMTAEGIDGMGRLADSKTMEKIEDRQESRYYISGHLGTNNKRAFF